MVGGCAVGCVPADNDTELRAVTQRIVRVRVDQVRDGHGITEPFEETIENGVDLTWSLRLGIEVLGSVKEGYSSPSNTKVLCRSSPSCTTCRPSGRRTEIFATAPY